MEKQIEELQLRISNLERSYSEFRSNMTRKISYLEEELGNIENTNNDLYELRNSFDDITNQNSAYREDAEEIKSKMGYIYSRLETSISILTKAGILPKKLKDKQGSEKKSSLPFNEVPGPAPVAPVPQVRAAVEVATGVRGRRGRAQAIPRFQPMEDAIAMDELTHEANIPEN